MNHVTAFGSQRRGTRPARNNFAPRRLTLSFEPFEYDPDAEYFLGGLIKSAGRSVGQAASGVGRFVDKTTTIVGKIPVAGDVARFGVGAARLGLGSTAIAIDTGLRVARGQNLGKAFRGAVGGQLDAARSQLRLAEMVAPFIPGIGTGVGAALAAANALASGKPITDALIAAARGALPGGAIAQTAFDAALNLAKGKSLSQSVLEAARDRLPGGPASRAAFDGAVALAQGKRLQDAAFAAAGRILPPSPYAADALAFVKRVANGQNVQNAALSVVGQRAIRQIENRAGIARRELKLVSGPARPPYRMGTAAFGSRHRP